MKKPVRLTPLLIVRDAARAIEFYVRALGVTEIVRYENKINRTVSHAELMFEGATFSVTEEARSWNSDAPPSLGGSPVVLQLSVEDADALFERVSQAGAKVIFPLQEFCGERMGRVQDPFGHLWIISQRIEDLSSEEIQRRRDALFQQLAAAQGRRSAASGAENAATVENTAASRKT